MHWLASHSFTRSFSAISFSSDLDAAFFRAFTLSYPYAPANYYEKNGKHYVIYDELVEGIPGTIKNKVRIMDDRKVEIIKSGITNTHMVFEKDKINMTQYETPYGEMMIGVFTKDIRFEEQDEKITVHVNYALDINGDPVADCNIDIKITALGR